jgi:hypothetical protein
MIAPSRECSPGVRRLVIACFLSPGLFACDVTEPRISHLELDEQAGIEVAGARDVPFRATLAWDAASGDIYYESEDGSLRAASVAQAGTRIIDPSRDHVEISAGKEAVYFVTDRAGERSAIYRAVGSRTILLSDRAPATSPLSAVDGMLVLAGPGEIAAYIVAPDTLYAFDAVAGTRQVIAAGCVRVVAFAPDGERLICRVDGPRDGGYALVDLARRTLTRIDAAPSEPGSNPRLIRWHTDAVRLLFTSNGRFRVREIESGEAQALWLPPPAAGPRSIDHLNYAWSADGERFAFWAHECLRLNIGGSCTFGQSILHVVELTTNTGSTAVVVKGERGGEQLVFAPDGRAIAYVFDGRIWVQTLN